MSCFVIAEAGVNHNGSLEMALKLVDVAADAGADAVKFQSFRAASLVKKGTAKASYQEAATGDGDQHDMIAALELDETQHESIRERCAARGIEFMSTPFDEWALDLLLKLGVKRMKVPSGELTNRPFVEAVARCGIPVILSTGMATLPEVQRTADWLRAVRPDTDARQWLTILQCTSNYPASPADVNLRAMQTLQRSLDLPVGYSDHTLGTDIAVAAVALGATVIEKHFTLDTSLPGPDHKASLPPEQLAAMVRGIRAVEAALGDGVKQPAASEWPIRQLVRRSAFLRHEVPAGHTLAAHDLTFLRPGDGIGPEHAHELAGRRTTRGLTAGHRLDWKDLT
jgi:N,N'-diacetyllegionaminate synthase